MKNNVEQIAKLLRYYSLVSTTEAGSGHPSSCLSASDLMAVLMFGGFFKADLENTENVNNDRLIFSKGHAAPLFYSMYAVAGKVSEAEMLSLRKFDSKLEGHPTLDFKYTEVPTGSLGQGLGVGVGMALNAKADKLLYNTFVLLGDSEMAEGSVWEAMASASYYKLNNLVAILDCNRLGQRGETMFGHHTEIYEAKAKAFGWEVCVVDGHNTNEIMEAYKHINKLTDKPLMIIAKTLKGKGISFIADKDSWHGKPLSKDELKLALAELGEVDKTIVGEVSQRESANQQISKSANLEFKLTDYPKDKKVATRKAYGNALANLADVMPNVVVLDAETSNSTYADSVKKNHSEKFFEMFIAEQNMVSVALGFSKRGKIPFVSTFAAFFTRAFDQVRMSQYAGSNIKFIGSHAGVSIGEDGASQMALEDIAMFRTVHNGVVLYPSDAVSTEKLVLESAKNFGNVYIRTTRKDGAILYDQNEQFPIGGSKTLKSSSSDVATVVGAGVTLHEALKAYEELKKEGINIRVIDLYSIKPLDVETLKKAAVETKNIITVEDHFKEGGLGETVAASLCDFSEHHVLVNLVVTKTPRSGKPEELLAYEGIDAQAIIKKIKEVVSSKL
jgi:transketolase